MCEVSPELLAEIERLEALERGSASDDLDSDSTDEDSFLRPARPSSTIDPGDTDESYSATTQRLRSAFFRHLEPRIREGEEKAEDADDTAEDSDGPNPFYLPEITTYLLHHYIHHACFYTSIMRYPERYASDYEGGAPVDGMLEPLYNNVVESVFAAIKSVDIFRHPDPIHVVTPKKSPLTVRELVMNLKERLDKGLCDLKQTKKTGRGPIYSITTNTRAQRRVEPLPDPQDTDTQSGDDEDGEVGDEEVGDEEVGDEEVGDAAVVESWSKALPRSPQKKKRRMVKYLAPHLPGTINLLPSLTESAGKCKTSGKSAEKGGKSAANGKSAEKGRKSAESGDSAEKGGKSVEDGDSAKKGGKSVEDGDSAKKGGKSVEDGESAESGDGETAEERGKRNLRAAPVAALQDVTAMSLMEFLSEHAEDLSPAPDKDKPPAPRPRKYLYLLHPPRSRKKTRNWERDWNGRFPTPPIHQQTLVIPIPWGNKRPGPQTKRFNCVNTCSGDNLAVAAIREERLSNGQLSKHCRRWGRRTLAESLHQTTNCSDGFLSGLDNMREELGSLAGLDMDESVVDMWDAERTVYNLFTNGNGAIATAVHCQCGVRREPYLDYVLQAQAGENSPDIRHQLHHQLHLDTPYYRQCPDCSTHYNKLDIYVNSLDPYMLAVEVHGTSGADCKQAWEQIPDVISLPNGPSFHFAGLTAFKGTDHFILLLPDLEKPGMAGRQGNFYLYNGLATPLVARVDASVFQHKDFVLKPSLGLYFLRP